MAAAVDEAPTDKLEAKVVLALVAMGLAVFVISNDFTSLAVALPQIERDLGADVGTVQWVINAYALVFGVLIVTGGRLADIFGRRRMFFIGIAIFAAFSALGGAAQSAPMLIAARALMAIGGAMIWPAVVGMVFAIVPPSRAGLAGGLILGVSGIGNAFGPMIGGLLTDELSWRWVLFLNLPIAAIATAVTYTTVPRDSASGERERMDYAGVATLSLSLVSLLVALDQSTDWGWGDPRIIGMLVVSVAAFWAFVITQRHGRGHALVPPDVVANRTFLTACVATLLASGTFFAVLLYAPQFTQKILGYDALQSGVALLPMMAVFGLTSFAAGPLYNKLGGRPLLLAGAALMPLGVLALSFLQADSDYLAMVPGLAILGVGCGLFYSALTTVAMTSLDPAPTGVGGGILYMFQLVGGSIGLGLTTTVVLSGDGFVDGLQAGFRVDAAFGVAALIAASYVVKRATTRAG
jgi:EmrB/QacA subfamily drug resistance transporter